MMIYKILKTCCYFFKRAHLNTTDLDCSVDWGSLMVIYFFLNGNDDTSFCFVPQTVNEIGRPTPSFMTSSSTALKLKFSIMDLFSKCEQICRKLRISVIFTEETFNGKLHFLCSVRSIEITIDLSFAKYFFTMYMVFFC